MEWGDHRPSTAQPASHELIVNSLGEVYVSVSVEWRVERPLRGLDRWMDDLSTRKPLIGETPDDPQRLLHMSLACCLPESLLVLSVCYVCYLSVCLCDNNAKASADVFDERKRRGRTDGL